jgi:Na+/H+ antiporter NhaD/arsenite permease-like protein
MSPLWVASLVFLLTYALIVTERLNRSILALLGAGIMIVCGVLGQEEAIHGIDFNTIALLTGMMVLVSITRRTGLFEFLAVWATKRAGARPWAMLLMLAAMTAVVSGALDNVTTVMLFAPVTLAVARTLDVPPYPFLFAEIFASNTGGTATLIGDPPNILIGSAAGLGFNDFLANTAPVVVPILGAQLLAFHWIWGRHLRTTSEARARVLALDERETIGDPPLLRSSLIVMGAVLAAFVLARQLRLEPGTIALLGAAVLMLLHNIEHHREKEKQSLRVTETFNEVDWITIFFFVGLFVVVHGLEVAGVIDILSRTLIGLTGGSFAATVSIVLWGSALLTGFVDNIPLVATLVPLIKSLAPVFGADKLQPLWWALSLGACLGGNGTVIGASANLMVAGIAERHGVDFSFARYFKHGFALMLLSIAIAQAYLWLRYL